MQAKRRDHPVNWGEPAPAFICRTRLHERFVFDSVAGRYVVLSFLGGDSQIESEQFLTGISSIRERFDDVNLSFFGVSTDPQDLERPLLRDSIPGIRFFWDFDRSVNEMYGVIAVDGTYRKLTYVLDPALRVLSIIQIPGEGHLRALLEVLKRLPPIPPARRAAPHAPVLVIPRLFEPALCRELIAYYDRLGGEDSGFMREVDGKTRPFIDYGHKRRRDRLVEDKTLARACMVRIHDRLVPLIEKAFQFKVTRMERYVVACYDAAEGGHFRAHRDNTTKGTAHRRFAVSLFLNSGDYEGGFLQFPEFGTSLYSAPAGGAVVFGCSLLHEATPVTRGKRYMFLPFLYDDAAAHLRAQNLKYLDLGVDERGQVVGD
jgi:predicted 2-oxoglutarate/Fe(II)-dependent dioxygenase YbiX/peroxiredoxin